MKQAGVRVPRLLQRSPTEPSDTFPSRLVHQRRSFLPTGCATSIHRRGLDAPSAASPAAQVGAAAVSQRSSGPAVLSSSSCPQPEPGYSHDRGARQPGATVPWGEALRVISDRSLDRSQRILTWRILHGKLGIGQSCAGRAWARGLRLPHSATLSWRTDRRACALSRPLQGLRLRLRLVTLTCLLAVRQTAQTQQQHNRQPGLLQRASWGTCGPPFSVTGC